ncbi:adhesion G-protein coupled receptor F1-like [Rhinichthys klamathensis goyatoka]|uniref:adhesion G-protein coupled receptor F1-like n=1 Tax=Rhinichthys klamathensis goyatoka TaxID=3034132 RepID=UPI0024B59593|nr:adhesion G-protein coupled receptor F1-like [Rhinichthys klamathensis goyatoka]
MSGYNVTDPNLPINSNNTCKDIDECLLSPSVCGPDSNCTNEIGSYNCSCLDGFTVTNSSLTISINNTCTATTATTPAPNTTTTSITTNPTTTTTAPTTTTIYITTKSTTNTTATPIIIEENYKTVSTFKAPVRVTGFRPGSIIVDYEIFSTSNNPANFVDANSKVAKNLQSIGYNVAVDHFAESDERCATLKHRINCTDNDPEELTCRLKIPELRGFSYGQSNVTIEKVADVLTCNNKTLGDGKEGAILLGPCEKGKEGNITYLCKSTEWKETARNCTLQVIIEIEKKVENLVPKDIPVVISELSTATVGNKQEITQSPATVQRIVDILVKIANISQSIFINEPVMKDFLTAVNVLVLNESSSSWKKLNTSNTSVALLSAIENISDRLTDANFTIIEKSIELNKIVTNSNSSSSYRIISSLQNSTTEILIPQIPVSTSITIIIFTTLDNVLPTRNTSNNNDTNNNVRINGDVVVVKVNQTVNNISFVFDITDQSLGNPQCVFWNFSLDAWDSSGCEVKPSGNKLGNITCECNHTTSFSILMSPFPDESDFLAYITYIGVAISMASLILCLIIEIIVWKSITRNDTSYMRHVSIVNIAVSLLIANICFIIGAAAVAKQKQPTSVDRCSPAVFFMHFFYLALFFWMLISALLLFYRTVMVLSQMSRARMMAIAFIVGYGAPLLIAVITVASTAGPQKYITKQLACWLNWDESKALLAFVIPALTIVAINLVVLIVVLYKMLRRGVGATTQPDEKHALVVIARCVAILTPIFGLTWAFGIGTMVSREVGFHVVFTILNSLQVSLSVSIFKNIYISMQFLSIFNYNNILL